MPFLSILKPELFSTPPKENTTDGDSLMNRKNYFGTPPS
jgi:hypothetical protein